MNNKVTYTQIEKRNLQLIKELLHNICDIEKDFRRYQSVRKYDEEAFYKTIEYLCLAYHSMDDIRYVIDIIAHERLESKIEKQKKMLEKMDIND